MALETEVGLALIEARAAADHHLAVLITIGGNGEPQVSVVNAGIVDHPTGGDPRVALVARGGTKKLDNLRRQGRATLVFKDGWEWVAVRGDVELIGPDDPGDIDEEGLRALLRDVFAAAGGHHPDLDEYDRVMAAEGRTAVLVTPQRIWSNPVGTEHKEPEA